MKKALYGMMLSSLLLYKHFRKDLESIGFIINSYDLCVANRTIKVKQQTVTGHVDHVKVSQESPEVNTEFFNWCENKYGSKINGHVKIMEGKKHEYFAMKLDYINQGKLKVTVRDYNKEVKKRFPGDLLDNVECPLITRLFNINIGSKSLNKNRKDIFHTYIIKCMFLAKRSRPDILV